MANKVKMTSVNILEEVYFKFKKDTVETDLTLQKIVNRTLDLYCNNPEFKNKIDNHKTLNLKNLKY
jgi:hypothetical protein